MINIHRIAIAALLTIVSVGGVAADNEAQSIGQPTSDKSGFVIDAEAEAILLAGSNEFAPYYIMSNNHGLFSQSKDALIKLGINHKNDTTKRFNYGFGANLVGGATSSTPYLRFAPDNAEGIAVKGGTLIPYDRRPAAFWIQQLFGELRYRGVFLTVGMKEHSSALLSPTLSSGDLIESGNSRPIPEVRVGFNSFQNIPFTNGWLQIQGEISYGKMTDNAWLRNHYNYYDNHIAQGVLYTYKRCYFRTKPSQPFSAAFGMQVGAFFGGETSWYEYGKKVKEIRHSENLKQFFKMFIPTDGGLDYYSGSSLGSWDVMFRYRLPDNTELKAYFQKPFEDGSGIGFLNGFDGIWGVEYKSNRSGWITGIVAEYLDFTNQSGPMHWDPDDAPGTTIINRAEGFDNYYNNSEYNSYANYGMAIGTPFMVSPIYNTDGSILFATNCIRGFHLGIEGNISSCISYRMLGGYRRSWGTYRVPFISPRSDTSFMVEATYSPRSLSGLQIKAAFGLDHGTLLGNNTGAMITARYTGKLLSF